MEARVATLVGGYLYGLAARRLASLSWRLKKAVRKKEEVGVTVRNESNAAAGRGEKCQRENRERSRLISQIRHADWLDDDGRGKRSLKAHGGAWVTEAGARRGHGLDEGFPMHGVCNDGEKVSGATPVRRR